MYKILVRAGTRPAGSVVTIDGVGKVTVGSPRNVSDAEAEKFRRHHPSGKGPTLLQAFQGDPNVEVTTYDPNAGASGSDKTKEKK
jgi:hypothetical protein